MEPAAVEIGSQDDVERALDGGISDRQTLESWRRAQASVPEASRKRLGGDRRWVY